MSPTSSIFDSVVPASPASANLLARQRRERQDNERLIAMEQKLRLFDAL